jgi:KDO2-lipid IV(A) lauroyltransferase
VGLTGLVWAVGGRLPRRVGDALACIASVPLAALPLPAVAAWADSVEAGTGVRPGYRGRRRLLENWARNALWSLSLARWSDDEVLRVVRIADADVTKLRDSLAGPGMVAALPHMGSWDFAGAWCARVGIKVVSVAEPDLMRLLTGDVRARRLVCLLADRDLGARGLAVPWPGGGELRVPAGPALLARRTGADLRVVTTHFDGGRLEIRISDPVPGDSAAELMTGVVAGFADAVRDDPSNWLMLRRAL